MREWQGQNVVVIGAARQGLAATRFLAKQGAKVTLTDKQPENLLFHVKDQFKGQVVEFSFGSHPLELLDHADALCLSGGVPLTIPLVKEAEKRHILLTNDSQIFMEAVNANVIGITGSAGKTTTTVLTGAIAKAALEPKVRVWVGGNIGYPMIDHLDEIKPEDWVVLEFSSFQLEQMTISPQLAVILNITPNHLDRHATMEAYTEAKARILAFQEKSNIAILNRDDQGSIELQNRVKGKLITFGFDQPTDPGMAIFLHEGTIAWSDGKSLEKLVPAKILRLPGKHNLANALAACAVAASLGFPLEAMEKGIAEVKGIPHRLEVVREHNGIRWINDSIATAPERVMAAIQSTPSPLVLLLGGRDKNLPWQDLARLLHTIQPKTILFGEAATLIFQAFKEIEGKDPAYPIHLVNTLEEAVITASKIAKPGDSVLLSPGGTSFDVYRDFEERGEHFKALVKELA